MSSGGSSSGWSRLLELMALALPAGGSSVRLFDLVQLHVVSEQLGRLVDVVPGQLDGQVRVAVQSSLHQGLVLAGDVALRPTRGEAVRPSPVELGRLSQRRGQLLESGTGTGAEQRGVKLGVSGGPLLGNGLALCIDRGRGASQA